MPGARRLGRPRTAWIDNIKSWTGLCGRESTSMVWPTLGSRKAKEQNRTFRASRRRREMYCGHPRLCVCLSVSVCVCLSAAACLRYCTDPDVTWGSGRGCHQVVHYWADSQSGNGLRCYGNVTRTPNVSESMLVLALCLVINSFHKPGYFAGFRCLSLT